MEEKEQNFDFLKNYQVLPVSYNYIILAIIYKAIITTEIINSLNTHHYYFIYIDFLTNQMRYLTLCSRLISFNSHFIFVKIMNYKLIVKIVKVSL